MKVRHWAITLTEIESSLSALLTQLCAVAFQRVVWMTWIDVVSDFMSIHAWKAIKVKKMTKATPSDMEAVFLKLIPAIDTESLFL